MKQQDQFQRLLNSPLQLIDKPEALDDFWASLSDRANQNWYISDLGGSALPDAPADEAHVQEFIVRCDTLIRRSFDAGQTPRIEVDDAIRPTFVRLHSDLSLNGGQSEDWVLSLAAPSSVPDESSKGGSLLRWFSGRRAASPETELTGADATTATRINDQPDPEPPQAAAGANQSAKPVDPAREQSVSARASKPRKGDGDSPDSTREIGYLERFDGKLIAIRKWDDLDQLWAAIHGRAGDNWYIYTIGEPPPEEPWDSQAVHKFLLDIDATLRQEHKEDYCGIVYADNPTNPGFVKIYDPHNLGMVCGSSGTRTLPGWTISQVKPVELKTPDEPAPRGFKRWKGFFGKHQ